MGGGAGTEGLLPEPVRIIGRHFARARGGSHRGATDENPVELCSVREIMKKNRLAHDAPKLNAIPQLAPYRNLRHAGPVGVVYVEVPTHRPPLGGIYFWDPGHLCPALPPPRAGSARCKLQFPASAANCNLHRVAAGASTQSGRRTAGGGLPNGHHRRRSRVFRDYPAACGRFESAGRLPRFGAKFHAIACFRAAKRAAARARSRRANDMHDIRE
eukprot:gene22640-biopygen8785